MGSYDSKLKKLISGLPRNQLILKISKDANECEKQHFPTFFPQEMWKNV